MVAELDVNAAPSAADGLHQQEAFGATSVGGPITPLTVDRFNIDIVLHSED